MATETFSDEDLGIGTLFSDADVGLEEKPSFNPTSEDLARIAGIPWDATPPLKPSTGIPLDQARHETFQKLIVPPQTMQNAWDAISAYAGGAVSEPGVEPFTPAQVQEELAAPDRPPTRAAKIASGIQAGGINLAEGFTTPEGIALVAAGGIPGAAGRLINAGFLAETLRQTPEIYQKLGTAFGSGDEAAEAEALFDAASHGIFALGTTHGTFKGINPAQIKRSVQDFIARTPKEQRQQIYEKGAPDARQIGKTEEVLPTVESSEGTKSEVALKGPSFDEMVQRIESDQPLGTETHQGELQRTGGITGFAYDLGLKARTPEDVQLLKDLTAKWSAKAKELREQLKEGKATMQEASAAVYKTQTANEAHQAATGVKADTGEVMESALKSLRQSIPGFEPKFPHENYKAAVEAKTKILQTTPDQPEARASVRVGETVPSLGPGAASSQDIGTQSQITQLTQSIENTVSPKQSISQRMQSAVTSVGQTLRGAPQTAGQAIKTGVQRLAAVGGAIKSGLTKLPTFTDFKRILGQWDGADQRAAFETREFVKTINKQIPKDRQEAITNWIQAGGDPATLQQRAAASTNPKLRKGYEAALTLTADEKIAAQNISNYLDAKLQEGLQSGLLEHGLENYINQVWKKPNPVTQKLQADLFTGKLQPNFKFSKQRVFDHYFEGEQAGYVPANKTVGALVGIYDQSFNRALSARAFIKNLTEGKAGDGRPLVAVSGSAGVVPRGQPPEALLVRPKTKPEDTADYRSLDHPAMRKWMWQTQTHEGTPVFVQGDLLVHPEIYQHLKNVLGKSAWRQNKLGRAILTTEATIKQLMFSASGFHQVQETLHALGHRVNPMNLSDIDFNNPVHKEAVEHGLQLASYDAMEQFTDGLGSGPIINKIPIIGKRILGPYTEMLFQDWIPRLKMTMYEHALSRNTERYRDQLNSGQMTKDQLLELTAKQANAAFGEQNYNWIGRSKTTQDSLRAFIVAPDFLEARAKFVGQAVRSHGREQLVALGLLAATQYITARILNKAIDDDYHWDKPFSLVAGKHEYELRTIPGDIAHLIKDPKKFATSRLAPIVRQGVEFVTGRDWRGVKRDALDQIKDFVKLPVPISMRKQDDQRWWETFLNAFGIHERSATASQEIADKARQFREKAKGKADVEILEGNESPYRKLRVSLDVGNEKAALQALQELRKTHSDSRILSTMQSHIRHPFTGSAALERKFRQSLEPVEQKKYQEAMVERKERYQKFKQLWAKRGQKPSAQAALKEPQALTDEDVGL
jgi:hypothetical protein